MITLKFSYCFDSHIHSDNSPDGNNTVSHICESAVEKGLQGITITDHCEVNLFYKDLYDRTVRQSCFEVSKAASVFKDFIGIFLGIELGQPLQDIAAAEKALTLGRFDFVIASLHNVRGQPDFYYINYDKENVYDLLDSYYNELLQMAMWNEFDVLGHLTYPLRYIVGEHGISVDMSRYDKIIDEIFAVLINNGKGIEINTSGLRQKIGVTLPDEKYIKRYHDLGGQILTIGSDAHNANDVGAGIQEGMEIAYNAGFRHITLFKNRTPIRLPIYPEKMDE